MAENNIDLVNRGLVIKHHMGWQDYGDLATHTTPITLTSADTPYKITNDGLGITTNKIHQIYDHCDIWNTATNQLDFTSLKVGDTVDIRIDLTFDAANNNTEVDLELILGVGHADSFTLGGAHEHWKTSGEHSICSQTGFYIGYDFVKDYPAEITLMADTPNSTVKVNGFYIRTIARS